MLNFKELRKSKNYTINKATIGDILFTAITYPAIALLKTEVVGIQSYEKKYKGKETKKGKSLKLNVIAYYGESTLNLKTQKVSTDSFGLEPFVCKSVEEAQDYLVQYHKDNKQGLSDEYQLQIEVNDNALALIQSEIIDKIKDENHELKH